MTRWNASSKPLICAAVVALVGLSGYAQETETGPSECEQNFLLPPDENGDQAVTEFGERLCANEMDIDDAETRLDAIDMDGGRLDMAEEDIADNAMTIAENKMEADTAIAANEATIAANKTAADTAIAANEATIAANKTAADTAIAANEAAIESNDMEIAANAGAIQTNVAGISTNAGAISANLARIESNDADIAANVARLDMHQGLVTNNIARLDGHDAMFASHASLIDGNTRSIQMLDERVSQVAAMAAALSAVPNAPSTGEQFFIGVGMGNHDGESSLAIGLSGRVGPNQNILVNAGVANSGGETTVRAGVGWAF